jgi:sugar phosphate permease
MTETIEGTPTNAAGRLKRLRAMVLTMICVAGVINDLDRSTLAIANPLIRGELGLSRVEMGALLSAFSWSYALAQLPMGAMIDRVGPRLMLGAGMVLWSVAQACGGFVTSLRQFLWARVFLGLGEAGAACSSSWASSGCWWRSRGMPSTGLRIRLASRKKTSGRSGAMRFGWLVPSA